jgi:preprotein translocase subunit YajC
MLFALPKKFEGNIRMDNIWILAQTEGNDGISSVPVSSENQTISTTQADSNPPEAGQETAPTKPLFPIWLFLPVILVMFFMFFRAPQKQKQQRKKLEQSLEKNDKVLTIGGIIGTIVDLKDDEITLKVDESNNTKIKIRRSAIGRNLSKD